MRGEAQRMEAGGTAAHHGLRRAVAADAAALTRLRAVMLSETGMLPAGAGPGWRDNARAWFELVIEDRGNFAAFVTEEPGSGVVSCAAGTCQRHAPSPANPGGVQGLVFNMSTDPGFRRRGHARACLEALLAWFREETTAGVVNLNATGDGIALYQSLGFTAPRYPALRLRLERPAGEAHGRGFEPQNGARDDLSSPGGLHRRA